MIKLDDEYKYSQEVPKLPWFHSPLIESKCLSEATGCTVLLKLDLHQPSGSFKSRGVGNFCLKALQSLAPSSPLPHFYISSGGNAGLAAVVAARSLGCSCTVVVPLLTTPLMINKIRKAGGEVVQQGESWAEADEYLREMMKKEARDGAVGVYCPPFDHPDVWEGNSTLITELLHDLSGAPPAAIIASVGGGGLFCGLQLGLQKHSLSHVPLIAVETQGAASLNTSLVAGANTALPAITSIAISLGARKVADKCFELAQRENVRSIVLEDAQAARACVRFAEEERCMVEAACGASLAVCYEGVLRKVVKGLSKEDTVVVVVCGGSNISLEMLEGYRKTYGDPIKSES
ncbi:pyridoxal-phosphate dependent enzyme [Kalaharituber pfeilii]|nr:pyridoxal-phosphate dependent enzyme [Kalaharituber pfeilii]